MRATIAAVLFVAALGSVSAHDPITTRVTWAREIAPIIEARCVSCHSPGGRAPMALTTYAEVRPWARAIREEVLARRMPKWHAMRGYGDFVNDPSLSPFEIALITAWVDGGAPASTNQPRTDPTALTLHAERDAKRTDGLRQRTLACSSQRAPAGRLVAVQPVLQPGGSLRLRLAFPDGSQQPLLAVRDFDPRFRDTYWLRTPIGIPPGTRLVADPPAAPGCTLTIFTSPG